MIMLYNYIFYFQDIIRLSIVKFVLCIRMQDMLPPLKWNVFTYPLSKERVTS